MKKENHEEHVWFQTVCVCVSWAVSWSIRIGHAVQKNFGPAKDHYCGPPYLSPGVFSPTLPGRARFSAAEARNRVIPLNAGEKTERLG